MSLKTTNQPIPIPDRSEKLNLLFDFYDKFGQLTWAEKMRAVQYTGFPYGRMLWCSWGTLLFGWLHLAYIGLLNPAIVLLLFCMVCVTLTWLTDSPVWFLFYAIAQIWASLRAHYNLYLLCYHGLRPWW